MLQATAGQAVSKSQVDRLGITITGAEKLHRIGGEPVRAIETAMRDPRMLSALCKILPAHDNGPIMRVQRTVMVDVVRGVGLVIREKTADTETDVLHQDRVEGY